MICVASDSKVLLSEQDAEELMGWELKRSEGWQNWAYARADQGNIQSEWTSGVIDVDSTNTTEKRHDDVSVNLIPGSTTDNNQASIACMIFWPNKDALVTHYFAGDCGDQVEADIMSWASDPVDVKNKKSPRVIINVRAVKLSHHEMLPAWKPRVIVISNGENSFHHHPTWETMILIAAYIWWRRSDNYRVWCTNFPVYSERLLTKSLGYIKHGIGSVQSINLKPDSGRTILADYLWKFWDMKMIREDRRPPKGKYRNPLRYCQAQGLGEVAVAEHLADYVKYHWNSISGWEITNFSSKNWEPPFKGAILVEQHRDGFVRAGSLPEIDADAINDSLEGNFADAASISEVISSSKLQPIQTKTVTLDISGLTKIDAGGIVLNKIEGAAIANRPQFPEIGDGGDGKSGSRNWQKSSPGNESTDAYAEQDTHTKNQENERTSTNITGAVPSPASLRDVGLSGKAFTNELYYFVGSQTQINDTSIPPPVMVDPRGGDLDILLAMLGTGAFVFKSPLTDKPDRIFLDSSDETWQRFYSVFNVKNDMSSCPISFEASSKGLDNMQVTIQLKALDINTSIAMDPEPPILSQNLLFDSSNNRSAFGTENPIGFTGTSHGYILSLGNDSNNQFLKIPLSQLLNLFNFASDSLILQSILKIEGFPDCVLDTSSGVKNCIWCFPGDDFSTHLRLQFTVDISTIGPKVQAILDEYLGLKVVINAMRVIAKQSWSWNLGEDGITLARQKPEFIFLCDMEIYNKKEGGESQKFRTAISFGRAETKFVVMLIPDKQDSTSVSNLLHWIGGFFGADINMEDIFPGIDMNKIFLHRLSITCPDSGPKKTELVMQVSWSSLILMLTLSYDSGFGFKATLFPQNKTTLAPVFSSIPFMPDYEDWDIVIPAGSTEPPEAGDLNEVITSLTGSQIDSVKEGPVSFQLTRATLKLERKKLSFMAMISGSDPNSQDVPCVKLDYGRLMLAYDFNDKTTKPTFSVATGISLQNSTKTYGTTLAAALSYEKGIWSLSGSVFRLNGGLLYSLFDQNSNLEMVNFFQKITLDLFLSYTYAGKDGNQFVAKGRLYLAGTTLAFDYFHKGKDGKGNPDWGFTADLIPPDSEGGGTSLVSIIASICGSDVKNSLPECLENLLFKPTPGEASRSLVHLSISRHAPDYLVFLLRIKITPSITATFLQLQKKVDRTPNAQGLMPTAASPPKRALMFTLGALPEIPDIPVIGKISQPFDELDIVWVDGGVVNEQKALYDCASAPKKKTKDLKTITAPETDAGSDKAECFSGGLTVGVKYTLDLWITSIHIDIEIGARIYLYGPPIYGTVHVDFWVFGFDVKFGAQNALVNSGIDLEQFYDLVLQKDVAGASIASVFHHDTNKNKLEWKADEEEPVHENNTDLPIIFSCQSGLIPSAKQETKEKEPWKVTPMDFSFMVSCKFAIQNGFLKTNKPGTTTEVESIPFASPAQDKIYGKPMKKPSTLGAIGSTLTLTITQQKDTIVELGLEADPPVPIWKKSEPVMKPVPSALWGEYLESQDPSSGDGTKQVDDLLSGSKGSINLMMGVTVSQPDTVKPTEAIKEFDVLKTMSQTAAVTHWPPNPSQNYK
ncbi:hypothetical protein TWF225_001489 [Orbilia oligospora]|nr:hypothetical protein TWF225_001489 [Orbilia oligospora]